MTDEKPKNPQEAKIKKGLPPRHDHTSFQTLHDITIPAGTILRAIGDDEYAAKVGFPGLGAAGQFVVTVPAGSAVPADALRKVIAS